MLDYSKLRNIIDDKKITLESLSKSIGLTRTGLSKSFSEKTLKVSTLEKIIEVLEINIFDLFDNSGKYTPLVNSKLPLHFKQFILPMFGDASAGYIVGYSQEEKEIYSETHSLPSHLGQNVRGFVVNGESMYPLLNRDDIVFCKRILDFSIHKFFQDDVYVIVSRHGIIVKHVVYEKEKNYLELIPSNKDFKVQVMDGSEVLEVWRAEGKYSLL